MGVGSHWNIWLLPMYLMFMAWAVPSLLTCLCFCDRVSPRLYQTTMAYHAQPRMTPVSLVKAMWQWCPGTAFTCQSPQHLAVFSLRGSSPGAVCSMLAFSIGAHTNICSYPPNQRCADHFIWRIFTGVVSFHLAAVGFCHPDLLS